MPSNNPFEYFDLDEKTASLVDVKKAYAKKLKETRPDEDPEGFMALREAFNHARQQIEWRSYDETTDEEDTHSIPSDDEPEEEINYWYDEKLEYHFNSSPSGKLIEKFIRWTADSKRQEVSEFWPKIFNDTALQKKQYFDEFKSAVKSRIFFDATKIEDFYYEDLDIDKPIEFETPEWLSDDLVIEFHNHFDFINEVPEDEWQGAQVQIIRKIFEPALLKNEIISAPIDDVNLLDIRAQNFERNNKDSFGSYYDKDKRKWMDMSPVGVAMQDIEEIISAPWQSSLIQRWEEIFNRDELQSIDEFQQLSDRLITLVLEKTKFNDADSPVLTPWLNKENVTLFENTFGWSRLTSTYEWEASRYQWLNLILKKMGIKNTTDQNKNWKVLSSDTINKEKNWYQNSPEEIKQANQANDTKTPWFIKPLWLVIIYILIRFIFSLTSG